MERHLANVQFAAIVLPHPMTVLRNIESTSFRQKDGPKRLDLSPTMIVATGF